VRKRIAGQDRGVLKTKGSRGKGSAVLSLGVSSAIDEACTKGIQGKRQSRHVMGHEGHDREHRGEGYLHWRCPKIL